MQGQAHGCHGTVYTDSEGHLGDAASPALALYRTRRGSGETHARSHDGGSSADRISRCRRRSIALDAMVDRSVRKSFLFLPRVAAPQMLGGFVGWGN